MDETKTLTNREAAAEALHRGDNEAGKAWAMLALAEEVGTLAAVALRAERMQTNPL